jgi:hypothetical protein
MSKSTEEYVLEIACLFPGCPTKCLYDIYVENTPELQLITNIIADDITEFRMLAKDKPVNPLNYRFLFDLTRKYGSHMFDNVYNIQKVYEILRSKWGDVLLFNEQYRSLMQKIIELNKAMTQCHSADQQASPLVHELKAMYEASNKISKETEMDLLSVMQTIRRTKKLPKCKSHFASIIDAMGIEFEVSDV